jgi:hypothetical protein
MKYNLQENKVLMSRLLTEALVKSQADEYPNYVPEAKWSGSYAKYEKLIVAIGGRPYPLPFGKKAAYEVKVGDDIILFYEAGIAYSTNNSIEFGYGVDPKYKGITLYDKSDKKDIKGAIELKNGISTWTDVKSADKVDTEESWVDYLQLALDIVGLVPGFGDIADIINAAISFGRGNYLEGFLSLIGAIPVVGSAISIPLKALLKTFNKAGDVLATAWRTKKSADELWLFIKNSGKLGKRELDLLVKGMGDVSDYITQFRKEADFVLPDSAGKALDEFAEFLKKNADEAEQLFVTAGKNADEADKLGSILKVRNELNQLGGMERIFGKGIARRLKNTFLTSALSPKELSALKGAMSLKFTKNMNNPGKLSVLMSMSPNQTKLINDIDIDIAAHIKKLPPADAEKFLADLANVGGASRAQKTEKALEFLRQRAPGVYDSAYKKLVKNAQDTQNPVYTQFMNSEVNALGSYFSGNYSEMAGLKSAKARWSNMAPVVYNELSDMGEDALMTAGIETKDDINGLFYPILKSTLNLASGGYVSNVVAPTAAAGVNAAKEIPIIGSLITKTADVLGANAGKAYDPNVKFQIVPDEDPRLKQQAKEKEKRIQQKKSWF